LQLGVGVHVVVHVQLLHGVSGLFLGGVSHGCLGQSPGGSICVGGLLLHTSHDVSVLGTDLLKLGLVQSVRKSFHEDHLEFTSSSHLVHLRASEISVGVVVGSGASLAVVNYSQFVHVEKLLIQSGNGSGSVGLLVKLDIGNLSDR